MTSQEKDVARKGRSRELDIIYDTADDLMRRGKISMLSVLINHATAICDYDGVDACIGWLSASLPVRMEPQVMDSRLRLYNKCYDVLREAGENPDEGLLGLNPTELP